MAEIRKKLTDTQFRLLVNVQLKYDNLAAEAKTAAEELNTVRMLVLDALDVDLNVRGYINAATQELVFEDQKQETEDD